MPPVSLPLNGGTWPARAGSHPISPHTATRLRTPIIRIADSISPGETLKRNRRHGKTGRRLDAQFSRSVAALHFTSSGLSGTVRVGLSGGFPMRDVFLSLKRLGLGAAFGVLFGVFGFGRPAEAAYPWELNFWLSGARYDGRVAECGRVLGTISNQFREKESKFWNSALQITAYGQIQETAFRPWQSDNIPRRYCSADGLLNDGTQHAVHYSIIEAVDFAG